jgi:hypothetical protein
MYVDTYVYVYILYIYTQIYEHICICRVEYVLWIGAWMGMSYIYIGDIVHLMEY